MTIIYGQAEIYKGGKLICHFSTSRYDSANKSAAHIQGVIVKRIKKEVKELGADYADVYIHYSMLPVGPNCTRGIGKVQP